MNKLQLLKKGAVKRTVFGDITIETEEISIRAQDGKFTLLESNYDIESFMELFGRVMNYNYDLRIDELVELLQKESVGIPDIAKQCMMDLSDGYKPEHAISGIVRWIRDIKADDPAIAEANISYSMAQRLSEHMIDAIRDISERYKSPYLPADTDWLDRALRTVMLDMFSKCRTIDDLSDAFKATGFRAILLRRAAECYYSGRYDGGR